MKIKKRNFLKNKKIKEIKEELGNYSIIIPKKAKVELLKIEDLPNILLINGEPLLMQTENKIIPTLKAVLSLEITEKYATVDMGAINFVIKGAVTVPKKMKSKTLRALKKNLQKAKISKKATYNKVAKVK